MKQATENIIMAIMIEMEQENITAGQGAGIIKLVMDILEPN